MNVIILAAGIGSRLGNPHPKCLTILKSGRSILQQQVENVRAVFPRAIIMAVVGFKKGMIMEAFPELLFAYNQDFDTTNTSKSLLRALRLLPPQTGALWLNGDVVFDKTLLGEAKTLVEAETSFVCVNRTKVGDEEIKYTVDNAGHIRDLSKTVVNGLGEAVGINYVGKQDVALLVRRLVECDAQAYFERGLELAIAHDGLKMVPFDVSRHACIEIDFRTDLEKANELL